jgi:hypothetical protein
MRTLVIATSAAAALFSSPAFTQQPSQATAEGGFRDRDLYPFCFRIRDGKQVAGPINVLIGTDQRTIKDSTGKEIGKEIYDAAAQKPEGQITETSNYLFPKPGTTAPAVAKVSFVTKVGDLGCGAGYYK